MLLKYLDPAFLDLTIGDIISYRGEMVITAEDADIVFADDYTPNENQKVIRSWDLEKLVSISLGNSIN